MIGLNSYKGPLCGGEKHISGMEVFRQHQFHKVCVCVAVCVIIHCILSFGCQVCVCVAEHTHLHVHTFPTLHSGAGSMLFSVPGSWVHVYFLYVSQCLAIPFLLAVA